TTSQPAARTTPEPEAPTTSGPSTPGVSEPTGNSNTDLPVPSPQYAASATDAAVQQQLDEFKNDNGLPEFKAEFISDKDIIIPSLMNPPTPLAQVIIAFFYVVPLFFVSVFFTSSFMEEKTNRKLIILLSAPVTPLQIILGKMLPYIGYSIICIIAITLLLRGNVLLGLAIFIPVMLFIISIYLMVALLYRTFKDQTFFSVLAVWGITAYLVAPAMFAGISDLSYISPLTLAVQMYRGESFGITQYLLSTTPMYLVFLLATFIGTRIFNEEYLMGFRPLHTKLSEAVYLVMNKNHLNVSVLFLSLCLIPVVFMVQLASIVIASNLPMPSALWVLLVMAVITEEIAKSAGIVVLLQNKMIKSPKGILTLSFVSALGFLIGEKLLLYLAMSVMSESVFTTAIFSAGLLIAPLIMHFVATSVVCLTTARLGTKYFPVAIIAGSVIHALYNLYIIGVIL
ncbi:MAG: ABC transporter permease, partial [Dehalococcoidia bacterium]